MEKYQDRVIQIVLSLEFYLSKLNGIGECYFDSVVRRMKAE